MKTCEVEGTKGIRKVLLTEDYIGLGSRMSKIKFIEIKAAEQVANDGRKFTPKLSICQLGPDNFNVNRSVSCDLDRLNSRWLKEEGLGLHLILRALGIQSLL